MESTNIRDKLVAQFHSLHKNIYQLEKAVDDFIREIYLFTEQCNIWTINKSEAIFYWELHYKWRVKVVVTEYSINYKYNLWDDEETECYIWTYEDRGKTIYDLKKVLEKFHTKKQEDFINVVPN